MLGILLDVDPHDCDPPHAVSRPDQVVELANAFVARGWDHSRPRLIAYPLQGRLQLLSGTHRQAAAKLAHIPVPVVVVSLAQVEAAWGTDDWHTLMSMGG